MIGRRLVAGTAVVAAVAAGGVAGALIGVPGLSGAATSTTKPNAPKANDAKPGHGPRGHFGPYIGGGKDVLDAGAKALNLSTDDLLAKLRDGKTTIADVAKQQNVDVQTVIDAMAAVAKSDITDLVNNPLPAPSRRSRRKGFDGFGFRGGDTSSARPPRRSASPTDELKTDLGKGQSIADVAKAKNVDVNKVIDALVSDAQSKHRRRGQGRPPHAGRRPTKIESGLTDMITKLVNNKHEPGDGHFGGRGHFGPGGGGPGVWGPNNGSNPTSTTAAPA